MDISDHFPIVFALNICEKSKPEDEAQFTYKRFYREEQMSTQAWTKSDWMEPHY